MGNKKRMDSRYYIWINGDFKIYELDYVRIEHMNLAEIEFQKIQYLTRQIYLIIVF